MSPDEEHPIAENEAPKEDEMNGPLTKEQFFEQMRQLTERARAAGLNPVQTMARTYIKHGMAIIEGLLASLENVDTTKKTKK